MTIQEVIITQNEISLQINRALSNFKKSKTRITKSYIEARLELLESNFQLFKNNHFDIITKATQEEKKTLTYFQNDTYYTCEDVYLEFKTLMKEKLGEWFISSSSSMTKEEVPISAPGKALRLPTIEIPAFSGSYIEWTGFYDLFKSLIHDNAQLSNIEKYHYLKSNLKGEAETLLKQFPLTEANYEKALEVLKSRYDNKRLIVHSHITRLLNQKKISIESAKGLRGLLDTTNELLNALNNVGVSTINWDPLITHIIVTKFDNESQRLWEQQLAGTREIPTTKQMLDFLEVRFRSLEALSVTQHKEVVTHQPSIRSFIADIEAICSLCSKDHYIYNCKEFVQLSPEERRDVVQEKQLCFNCLVPGHSVRFCKQFNSCKVCKRRHHSLLHLTSYDMQQALATQVNKEDNNEDKDTSQLMVHKANISDAQVLLATAMVRVIGKDGKIYQLRALIDQGSQASFITTSAARRLDLRIESHFSKVTGIDSKLSMVSKEVAMFDVFSLYDETPVVNVKARVLKSFASILPCQKMHLNFIPGIKALPLADLTFAKPSGIDLLLGAEIYAEIIKDGLKKHGSIIAQNSHLGWFILGKVERKDTQSREVVSMHSQLEREKLTQGFLQSRELCQKGKRPASKTKCEDTLEKTHSRTDSERYILPFSRHQRNKILFKQVGGFMGNEELQHKKKDSFKKRKKDN